MVDLRERLAEIKKLVDGGKYFTINRARQYGKTTTLAALEGYLADDYAVISTDFQFLGSCEYASEVSFSKAFAELLLQTVRNPRAPV